MNCERKQYIWTPYGSKLQVRELVLDCFGRTALVRCEAPECRCGFVDVMLSACTTDPMHNDVTRVFFDYDPSLPSRPAIHFECEQKPVTKKKVRIVYEA